MDHNKSTYLRCILVISTRWGNVGLDVTEERNADEAPAALGHFVIAHEDNQ